MTPDELHARAREALLRGDSAGAIADYRSYLEAEPEDAGAYLEMSAVYASINHWVEAADAAREAVDLDGEDVEARLYYARALTGMKKLDGAAYQLGRAVELAPDDARALRELGVVLYQKKLYGKAVERLTEATAKAPGDARAHYALGLAREATRDMGGAVASYRRAIAIDPALTDAYQTLADTLASMGEHEGAVGALNALLAIDRSNEQAAHNRDVLIRALADMHARRLLGKGLDAVSASALVREGNFRDRGGGRFTTPLAELRASIDDRGAARSLHFILLDPERASNEEDDHFKVTIVGKDGKTERASFATAATLTFLREALGCPMTHASELYARLLAGEETVAWGDAALSFGSAPHPDRPSIQRHGIVVALRD